MICIRWINSLASLPLQTEALLRRLAKLAWAIIPVRIPYLVSSRLGAATVRKPLSLMLLGTCTDSTIVLHTRSPTSYLVFSTCRSHDTCPWAVRYPTAVVLSPSYLDTATTIATATATATSPAPLHTQQPTDKDVQVKSMD